jgi:hypothetical protein
MTLPSTIRAGDTFEYRLELSAYPASEWTAALHLRRASGDGIDVDGTAADDVHVLAAAASVTADWAAGVYYYDLRLTSDEDAVATVETGRVEVLASLATAETIDRRTHVERVLEAIEAFLQTTATLEQRRYRIGDRELERHSLGELQELRRAYRRELAMMRARDSGRGPFKSYVTNFAQVR